MARMKETPRKRVKKVKKNAPVENSLDSEDEDDASSYASAFSPFYVYDIHVHMFL